MLKRGAIVVSIMALVLLGFYTGRTVLPGIYGHGAGAIAAGAGDAAGQPAEQQSTGTSSGPESTQPASAQTSGTSTTNTPAKDTYSIDVDVTAQKVKIMQGNQVIKTMVASTGMKGSETPLGTFEIQNRGEWFFSDKYKQGAKYWVSFKDWGVYLFHSVAMDENQKVIPEEEAKLGQPASHGCVRLSIENAKWIYDNIPAQTKVVIHT